MIKAISKSFIFESLSSAPSCHASTLLPLGDDRILAAWFAGSREGAADVGIWTSVRSHNVWSQPQRIPGLPPVAHWNPVLHRTLDGEIILYFKSGMRIASWKTCYVSSPDGISWSAPRELVPGDTSGGRGPVKNKCIRLSNGTLAAPASSEPSGEKWLAFVDISEDDGFTWSRQEYMAVPQFQGEDVGLIQPTLWQDPAGVHCLLRSNKGAIYRSDSADGRHWGLPYRTDLPNNNSGIDLAKDASERLWLVSNPVSENWGPRYPLTLSVSQDQGETFQTIETLESTPGEYSYPAIVSHESRLYITYTYNRERIVFLEISLE